jgi:hypothetical protein
MQQPMLTPFHPRDLVRNDRKQILTVTRCSQDGKVFVAEETEPYASEALELVDQTNVIRFVRRY